MDREWLKKRLSEDGSSDASSDGISAPARRDAATLSAPRAPRNRLLSTLSAEVQNRLIPSLKLVSLPMGMVMHETDDRITQVYFPNDAIVSVYNPMQSGASAENVVIGNDGMVGISALMGGSGISRAVVHIAGTAYQLPVKILKSEFDRHGEFLDLALRYLQSLITQTAQTAACNRHHSIDQQLCRWILLMLDRLPGKELKMTQENIAIMLGVRREGITQAAGRLQKLDVIQCWRGGITVKQRSVLESQSCECYSAVKRETDRLLPQCIAKTGVDESVAKRGSPNRALLVQ